MSRLHLAYGLVALVFAVTLPRFLWHVEFFATIDPVFRWMLLALMAVLGGAGVWLHGERAKREPWWLLGLVVGLAALREPRAMAALVAAGLACLTVGAVALRMLRADAASVAMRITAGQAVYTVVLAALGFAGQLRSPWLWLLLLPALFALRGLPWRWPAAPPAFERTPVTTIAWLAAVVSAALGAAFALTPSWQGDPVRLHLMLARVYEQQGSLTAPPFQTYAWYPQSFELLLSWMSVVGGGVAAAQLVAPAQFAVLLVLAYELGRKSGLSRESAFVGCVLGGATLPFLHFTVFTSKNDAAMSQYQLAALVALIEALGTGAAGWVGAGALLAGASAGVKHTALFGLAPLTALLGWAVWKAHSRALALALVTLALPAGAFWHLRTWRAHGDPAYPRGSAAALVSAAEDDHTSSAWARFAELPWSLHFRGRRHFESPSENSLGVTLLLSLALLPLRRRREWSVAMWGAAIFTFGALTYWATVLSVLRYALLPLLLLCLYSARNWTGRAGALAAGWAFAFALPVSIIQELHPATPRYLAGIITRDQFLVEALPGYGAARALGNGRARPGDVVRSVGDWALTYFPYPAMVDETFRNDRNYQPDDVRFLRGAAYRFLILPEAANLGDLERRARQNWALEPVSRDRWFRVYRLLPLE